MSEREAEEYETVVVGCGPAALAFCSNTYSNKNQTKCEERILVVERGKLYEERVVAEPSDVAQGEGGVGPYIDGKFSTYPAGTNVYRASEKHLRRAYDQVLRDLKPFLNADNQLNDLAPLEIRDGTASNDNCGDDRWKLKRYRAVYMEVERRFAWIQSMLCVARQNATILTETDVVSVDQNGSDGTWKICLRSKDGPIRCVRAKRLVLAGGRFLPTERWCSGLCTKFRRTEFGVRVCFDAGMSKVGTQIDCDVDAKTESCCELKQGTLDPKWILVRKDALVEWRTFCFCERGDVLQTQVGRWITLSGRADCEPTNTTNFGFMCRVKDRKLAERCVSLDKIASYSSFAIKVCDKTNFSHELTPYFGTEAAELLSDGLNAFFNKFASVLSNKCVLRGPCIEGVSMYPDVDDDMRVCGYDNLYAIGDCNGTFRGLVPSLISGYFLQNKLFC